jgi:hypothetical protein
VKLKPQIILKGTLLQRPITRITKDSSGFCTALLFHLNSFQETLATIFYFRVFFVTVIFSENAATRIFTLLLSNLQTHIRGSLEHSSSSFYISRRCQTSRINLLCILCTQRTIRERMRINSRGIERKERCGV